MEHKTAEIHHVHASIDDRAARQKEPLSLWFFVGVLCLGYGLVLTPVGIYEFSHPPSRTFNGLYRFYNDRILPTVARVVSSNAEAYDYLNESIRDWPDQRALAEWIREAGWTDVAHRDLSFGIVALHRAVKPRS